MQISPKYYPASECSNAQYENLNDTRCNQRVILTGLVVAFTGVAVLSLLPPLLPVPPPLLVLPPLPPPPNWTIKIIAIIIISTKARARHIIFF